MNAGVLYSWRPIDLIEKKELSHATTFGIDGAYYSVPTTPEVESETKTFLILTGIATASTIVRDKIRNRKLIESTLQLATNSAASKLAEYYSSSAKVELQAYREQIVNARAERLRSMFSPLDLNSRNSKNEAKLGGYVLLRSTVGAVPDEATDPGSFEVVSLTTREGAKKRQKISGVYGGAPHQLDEFRVISGALENVPSESTMDADLPFKFYRLDDRFMVDEDSPDIRPGLVNLRLQLSLTSQRNMNALETPEYEFSAHFSDLEHHKAELASVLKIIGGAIFSTKRAPSAFELGSNTVDVHVNQELPSSKKVLEYVNADHLQPFATEISPCGWELWPKMQENDRTATKDIEQLLFELDPFSVLKESQQGYIDQLENTFLEKNNDDYIVLTGTDKPVPTHYNLENVITLSGSHKSWGLGQSASNFGVAISTATALLQDVLDDEFKGGADLDAVNSNRSITQDDLGV